ncbi:ribonuclease HII [Alterisphingorhabdus coralli]|uniref:Ribonuclease HII n=1 Tax=Alterisphingorhabdus coralli TaxID=3071408 RepID=A0AA97F679_9SPHN|nr:ribonuclease HII [Parasphingorhabdus sp. SCSIO 66989]WOE74211.1 ribonuclease HII [Parasphingorhabdus sp. SCSIO 66989]
MQDIPIICGVDEAGRGPLAGPVVAAAVILPENHGITGLADSKKLTAKRRAELESQIRAHCAFGIGVVQAEEIDRINILQATMQAMIRAVDAINAGFNRVHVDGNRLPIWHYEAEAIIGGDASDPAISAASIIAKEHRDRLMAELAGEADLYGWRHNKGYGTKEHMIALEKYGATAQHRRSFAPVARVLAS